MPLYVQMANRMMEMLSNGRHECDILVYSPMETFWNYFEPDLSVKTGFGEEGPWIQDEHAKLIDNQFQLLCNRLVDRNLILIFLVLMQYRILRLRAAGWLMYFPGKAIQFLFCL